VALPLHEERRAVRVRAGIENLAAEPPPCGLIEVEHCVMDAYHDVVRLRHLRQRHPETHAGRAPRDAQACFWLAPPHPKLSDHLPCLFRELEHQSVLSLLCNAVKRLWDGE
jgi:hypothetical protein